MEKAAATVDGPSKTFHGMLSIETLYPPHAAEKMPSFARSVSILCPLCSTDGDMKRGRFRKFKVPKGLTGHFNSKHVTPRQEDERRTKRPRTTSPSKIPTNMAKTDDIKDAVKRWYNFVRLSSTFSAKSIPASIVGSFDRLYERNRGREGLYPEWRDFAAELVREVERTVAQTESFALSKVSSADIKNSSSIDDETSELPRGERGYKNSLPPLHSLASSERCTVSVFKKCVDALLRNKIGGTVIANAIEVSDQSDARDEDTYRKTRRRKKRKRSAPEDLESERLRLFLSVDRNGSTCLHWAGGTGNRPLVNYIISEIRRLDDPSLSAYTEATGGGPSSSGRTRGKDGRSFLHFAARHGRDALVDHVLHNFRAYAPFYVAPPSPTHPADGVGNDGTTPLMLASYGCHLSTIRLLIEKHGADVRARNKWDCTAAHFVALSNSADTGRVVEYLHGKGADFSAVQSNGHTPAHKASLKGNEATVRAIYGVLGPSERAKVSSRRDNDGKLPSGLWRGEAVFREWVASIGW